LYHFHIYTTNILHGTFSTSSISRIRHNSTRYAIFATEDAGTENAKEDEGTKNSKEDAGTYQEEACSTCQIDSKDEYYIINIGMLFFFNCEKHGDLEIKCHEAEKTD
jgi:hypothetical protein